MIGRLLLLGATGDLAGRFLLPALAGLHAAGQLPDGFRVVGAAQQDGDDAGFARHVDARLQAHAADVPAEARRRLLDGLGYCTVDLEDPATVAEALRRAGEGGGSSGTAVAVYLALPPALFPAALRALGAVGLPPGSRVVVEKPFGEDLDSAVALNALLAGVTDGLGEQARFRVDHVLGMPTVRDLLGLRAPGAVLEPVWNSAHVEQVDVLWEETLALEGRADFFDRAGAVKDVVQNHMLQLLALVALELPAGGELGDARLAALRAVRVPTAADAASRTRRARYTAGQLAGAGGAVPDYGQEEGVDPDRGTETYAELVLELDLPRWAGTRFVLRAGKGLAAGRKGVQLHFRGAAGAPSRGLWIGLDGAQGSPASSRADETALAPRPLVVPPPPQQGERAAYTAVLRDVLSGSSARSVSGEESEQAWRIVEPVLQAWAAGAVPLLEYAAGTAGPGLLPREGAVAG